MNSHQVSSSIVKYHQLSSIIINSHQVSSGIVKYRQVSSININYHQLSSFIIKYHRLSSIIINYHQLLSIIIKYHQLWSIFIKYRQVSSISITYPFTFKLTYCGWMWSINRQFARTKSPSHVGKYIPAPWSTSWVIGISTIFWWCLGWLKQKWGSVILFWKRLPHTEKDTI